MTPQEEVELLRKLIDCMEQITTVAEKLSKISRNLLERNKPQ